MSRKRPAEDDPSQREDDDVLDKLLRVLDETETARAGLVMQSQHLSQTVQVADVLHEMLTRERVRVNERLSETHSEMSVLHHLNAARLSLVNVPSQPSCPGHGSSGSGETSSSPPLPTSLPYGVLQGVLDANPARLPTLEEVLAKTDAALASLSGATARQPSAALGSLPLNAPPSAGAGPSSAYPCVYPFASLPATLQLPTLPSAFAGTLNASPAGVAGSSSASDALLPSALAGMLPLNTAPTAAAASSSASASVPAGAASPAASAPAAGAGVTRLTPQERIQAEVMLALAQSAKDEEGMPPPRQ